MKKIFIFLAVIILLLAAWRERFVLRKYFNSQVAGFRQTVMSRELASGAAEKLTDLTEQVFTGGALKSEINEPDSRLTVAGTISWTNRHRADYGLPPLSENRLLDRAAEAKLKDMFNRQYFEHQSPDGKGPADLAKAAGYNYIVIGENLALGNFKNDQALLMAWMNSPGHKANILNNKFTQIGIAVGRGAYEGKQVWMAVQEFGKPASDCPAVDKSLRAQIDARTLEVDRMGAGLAAEKQKMEAVQPQNQEEYDAYNAEVQKYNDLVRIYNNMLDQLKQLVARYNQQVKEFNACAR